MWFESRKSLIRVTSPEMDSKMRSLAMIRIMPLCDSNQIIPWFELGDLVVRITLLVTFCNLLNLLMIQVTQFIDSNHASRFGILGK